MSAPFPHLTTPGGIFSLIRDGRARSRAELSRLTGLAPSTITLRIDELLRAGYLCESGDGPSRGGRRPRTLAVAGEGRVVAGVDLGAHHASVVLYDMTGAGLARLRSSIDITRAPEVVLRGVHREILEVIDDELPGSTLVGVGIALPGPVESPSGRVVSPSRMPGWNGIDPAAILAGISGVRVRADNDANAMAWGEFIAAGRAQQHVIVVKAGSSIGTGIIADGRLYRGARGMAGDISHAPVADAPQVLCSCGRFGCLDAVAGGGAIVTALTRAGIAVDSVADVAALAADAHPLATRLLREAGLRVGASLSTIVSFFTPELVVLGGVLSTAESFVAGVRSSVYDLCLPLSTTGLELRESTGWEVGAHGVATMMLEDLLDPTEIDRELRSVH